MNLMENLEPLVRKGTWYWNADGKFTRLLPPAMDSNCNWISSDLTFRCHKWHKIFWDLLTQKSFVHSHCQECYKVVLIPRSFAELLEVEALQKRMADCKCGIDMREYTKHHYAAFWYNRGLDMAQGCYAEVRQWADDILGEDAIGKLPDVTIKRGCTEFEVQGTAGDSLHWCTGVQQNYIEQWLDSRLLFDPYDVMGQTEDIRQLIRLKWMRWAYPHGDETYIPHNAHEPLYKSCRVYHEEAISNTH